MTSRFPPDEGLRLFTWPDPLPGEADLLARLLEIPGFLLHVRKPTLARPALDALLSALPEAAKARVMLHDQPGLAAKHGVRGVVWNARHPLPDEAEIARSALRGPRAARPVFAVSAHTLAGLTEPAPGVDELLFAPVYDSLSKPGHGPRASIEDIRAALERGAPRPVIALGGVEEFRFLEILGAGFDGAAVLGSLWLPWMDGETPGTPDVPGVLLRAGRLADLWSLALRDGV